VPVFILTKTMANYFKSILRFGIDPVLKKHKNIIPYITEGKGFFITFDYSFWREGEDLGKILSLYLSPSL
jgi:hypothetical protein